MVVDDTHLLTGTMLADFMGADPRWEPVVRDGVNHFAMYRKRSILYTTMRLVVAAARQLSSGRDPARFLLAWKSAAGKNTSGTAPPCSGSSSGGKRWSSP